MVSKCILHCLVLLSLPCWVFSDPSSTVTSHGHGLLQRQFQKSTDSDHTAKEAQPESKLLAIMLYLNLTGLAFVSLLVMKLFCTRTTEDIECAVEDSSIGQQFPTVLTWAVIGIALICFNKYMYMKVEDGGFGFPCPMALTWCHMLMGMMMTQLIRVVKPDWMPALKGNSVDGKTFCTSILPVGVVFAAYLSIGNCAYLYLSVSYIQMLKSAGPIAVHLLACLAGVESVQISTVCAVVIICLGVGGASVGEGSFSLFGFLLQFCAFMLDGVRMVMLKTLTASSRCNLDPLSGLYYYSPVCVVALIGPVLYFEGGKLQSVVQTIHYSFYFILIVNALLAFSLNAILLSLFRVASPTTVSVASVVRDIVLTFGSAWWFHTELTAVQVAGYLSACFGVKLWDQIKARPQVFEKAILRPLFGKMKAARNEGIADESDPLLSRKGKP